MMKNDRRVAPFGKRLFNGHRQNARPRPLPDDFITRGLRRAYATTLAEPLPQALLDLLQRLE
jgi:hypothetical protein